jgi:hypothetical protein
MSEPTIALVFTPDRWVEELHRHCTDHGGARVRQVLIDPALALEEHYDVLVVSHRWPALTHGLVAEVHDRGRRVLGVYDREERAGRELLVAAGVDATVASDAGPAGIVAALRAFDDRRRAPALRDLGTDEPVADARRVAVVAGPSGAGATEVAIACADALPRGIVVDLDDVAPSIGPRLALPIEPNVRSAIDALEYDGEPVEHHVVAVPGRPLRAVVGLANVAAWPQVRPQEALRLVHMLARNADVIVHASGALEDLPITMARPRHAVTRAVVREATAIVAVGAGTPVGVGRFLAWVADVQLLAPGVPVHAAVNFAPKDAFRRGELGDEITRALPVASLTFVPADKRVTAAAWAGTTVARGPFTRAVASIVHAVAGGAPALRVAS